MKSDLSDINLDWVLLFITTEVIQQKVKARDAVKLIISDNILY